MGNRRIRGYSCHETFLPHVSVIDESAINQMQLTEPLRTRKSVVHQDGGTMKMQKELPNVISRSLPRFFSSLRATIIIKSSLLTILFFATGVSASATINSISSDWCQSC